MLIVVLVAFLNAASCRILLHSKRCIAAAAASSALPFAATSLSSPSSSAPEQDTFAHIAHLTLGQYGVHLVHVSIVLTLCGAVSIYVITIIAIAAHVLPQLPSMAVLLALFLLLLPFTFLRDLSFFSFASLIGTASYLLSFALIFYYGFTTGSGASASHFHLPASFLYPHSLLDLLSTFGILSFSLGIPVLTFSLQESMQSPQLFSRVMDATMLAVSCGLCIIGVLGVGLFGTARSLHSAVSPSVHHHSAVHERVVMDQVRPIILSNLPPDSALSLAANCLIAFTLLLTAPLSLAPALNLLEGILIPNNSSSATASSSSSLPEHKHLLSSASTSSSASASSSHGYASYGGVNDHHDLYNHSSDEDEEAAADSQQAAAAPSLSSSRQQQQQPVRILVRGKVNSLSSNEFVLAPITSSRSTSPSASPHLPAAGRTASTSSSSSLTSSLSSAVSTAAALLGASVLRALTLLCIVVLAWSVPCFSLIMSCIGLLTLSVLCFVLPPVFYLRLCSLGWAGKEEGSSWYRVWCMAFLAIGALCMIAGAAVVSRMKCE